MNISPVPWVLNPHPIHPHDRFVIFGANGEIVGVANLHRAEALANGALMAGAPKLLESLTAAMSHCKCSIAERDSGHLVDCWVPAAQEVIAQIEGRAS